MNSINPLRGYTIFSLLLLAILIVAAVAASGCASLVPNSVRPEFEHMSHLTQHMGDSTDYGANMANLVAHWDIKHAYVEIAEGVDLDRHWPEVNSNGEIIGPREEFTARIGYVFQVRQ